MRRSVLTLGVALACGGAEGSAPAPDVSAFVTALGAGDTLPAISRPAAYGGTLPCADCPGIETLLVLHPDGSYRLRERYLDRQAQATLSLGRWSQRTDSLRTVEVFHTTGIRRFSALGTLSLSALDQAGAPIASTRPPELRRVSAPPEMGGTLRARGEFRYFADAATFVECAGGRQFPVLGDSAYIRLQRAYLEQSLGTGAAVLVDLVGRLELRPGMEEGTQLESVVVDSFTVRPRSDACEATRVRALIAVGDWQLGALDGQPLPPLSRELQPTLRFVLSEPTMSGNGGCNRFTGRAVLRGTDLIPSALAMTQRLCADSLANGREAAYGRVLSGGGWFRAAGDTLVLSRDGRERARFWRR